MSRRPVTKGWNEPLLRLETDEISLSARIRRRLRSCRRGVLTGPRVVVAVPVVIGLTLLWDRS